MPFRRSAGNGGAEGIRTPDLRIANATLSQLSYGPAGTRLPAAAARIMRSRVGACQAAVPGGLFEDGSRRISGRREVASGTGKDGY